MQKKDNFFTDNPDILFHLEKRWDWDNLFRWLGQEEKDAVGAQTLDEYRKTWIDALTAFGEGVGTVIAANAVRVESEELQLNKSGDVTTGPALRESIQTLIELGTPGMGIAPKYGGLGAPFCLELIANELIFRACPSTSLNSCWWSPIAHVVDLFGTDREREMVIPRIATGEWSGSMALTEPDAGSDLGALRTYGEEQEDGSFRLYGSKRFISNGQSQVCLVLGKNAKGAEGLKNLNLYLCLREVDGRQNYLVTKLEHKVGLKGSATCELQFEGAKAWRLGKDGEGFKCMLKLMNDARLAVAYQGLGVMEGAFRLAKNYAEERESWGKPIARHELIAEKLLDMEVEILAVRSLCYRAAMYLATAYAGDKYLKAHQDLSEAQKADIKSKVARYQRRVRRWTPLLKYFTAERAFVNARTGVQIHGGYGFTTEYRAEWWVRESLILGIYEGTSQIQAMMVMKDTLKDVMKRPARFIELALGTRVQWLAEKDPLKRKLNKARQLYNSGVIAVILQLLKENVKANVGLSGATKPAGESATIDLKPAELLKIAKKLSKDLLKFTRLGPALLHAERLCEMKAYVALLEATVRDAKIDGSRRWIAERLAYKALPRMHQLKMEIETIDPVIHSRIG